MKYLFTFLFIFNINQAFSSNLFFEPQLVGEFSNWEQNVTGSTLDGLTAAQSYNVGLSLNMHYKPSTYFFTFEYAYLQNMVSYSDSDGFSGDDNWDSNSTSIKNDIYLHFGYDFKSFALSLAYSPMSSIEFSDYFINGIDEASFYGTSLKLQLHYPLSNKAKFLVYYSSSTYIEGEFDGESISFPETYAGVEFGELITTSYGIGLGYVF